MLNKENILSQTFYTKYFKRIFDVLFSLFALIVFAPLFFIIAIFIKIDSEGPIFYKQERVGLYEKPFMVYKFRTMMQNADIIGAKWTSVNDLRITRLGHFLRKSSIDELPQFINVFFGDMSVVGPRPEIFSLVNWDDEELRKMFLVKPGITGYAQIYGRSLSTAEQRRRNILNYVDEISFFNDIKIIFITIWQVTLTRGTN